MVTTLKNGGMPTDPRLDRIYELDWRSLNYLEGPSTGTEPLPPRSYTWGLALWLDQGQEGSCVGNGYSHELAASPVAVGGIDEKFAVEQVYWPAQMEDPWPGGSYPSADPKYDGTSVLTGAKVLQEKGFYTGYNWGITAQDIAQYVGHYGPSVLGLTWYNNMFTPASDGFIHPDGGVAGGHCILAVGVKIKWKSWVNNFISKNWGNVNMDQSYVILHNSWGQSWGFNGRAKLSLTDLDGLMKDSGEACFPKRNPLKKSV